MPNDLLPLICNRTIYQVHCKAYCSLAPSAPSLLTSSSSFSSQKAPQKTCSIAEKKKLSCWEIMMDDFQAPSKPATAPYWCSSLTITFPAFYMGFSDKILLGISIAFSSSDLLGWEWSTLYRQHFLIVFVDQHWFMFTFSAARGS